MVGVETQASKMMSRISAAKMDITASDRFPAGLRVLAVDDDPTCLMILARMLQRCSYEVTVRTRATEALSLLREKKDCFDLVISDVYMPDMDGFKLLEYVGLEMDLPVIMTSSHGETSVVMKGVTHGACDYLIKPVRIEELRNIWQHVLRKKRNDATKDVEASGSVEDTNERQQQKRGGGGEGGGSDDGDYTSSVNDESNNWKMAKRRKDEDDMDHDNDDPSTIKKQRVVWSVELHQQFVNAVNQLGIDKAVPKKILELMNVQGLTRENVASHLQKYRLYLRRLSGVQQPVAANAYCSSPEQIPFAPEQMPFPSFSGVPDMRALQLRHNTLASLQGAASMNRNSNLVDPSGVLMQLHPQTPAGYFSSNTNNVGKFPAPMLSIPSRGCGLDVMVEGAQISPRTPVDEVSGMVLNHHQFSNSNNLLQPGDGNDSNMCTAAGLHHPVLSVDKVHQAPVQYYGSTAVENSFGLQPNCRGFGSKMANLSLHHQLHDHGASSSGYNNNSSSGNSSKLLLPARFAAAAPAAEDGAGAGRFGGTDQTDNSFSVKLEGGNNQDDLFSIFLKPVS